MAKRSFLVNHQNSEHAIQVEFYNLLSRVNHPAVALTVAIPNQAIALLPASVGAHFHDEGAKGGFPDNVAFYPSPLYSGLLIIEFKRPGEKLKPKQVVMCRLLAEAGHRPYVCDVARDGFDLWLENYGLTVNF